MNLSSWINLLLLVVSVIAAGIAWRAVFAARASAREANEIQQRLLEIEMAREERELLASKRADFEVEISFGENYSYTFYCTNSGWLHFLNGKRGLQLVVLYVELGHARFP